MAIGSCGGEKRVPRACLFDYSCNKPRECGPPVNAMGVCPFAVINKLAVAFRRGSLVHCRSRPKGSVGAAQQVACASS